MKIAILSGKGGTGKTTVASNLSINIPGCIAIDTDVEEPNLHIFLKPEIEKNNIVTKEYPVIDSSKCNLCGKCGNFCRYNAIIPAKDQVVVFKELCHDCGGCKIVCPKEAISYKKRVIGSIYSGISECGIPVKYGELNIGEISGVKIIKDLKKSVEREKIVIIDSPPGTSCSTVAAVENSDYAIIVSEPTPFGVSDMKMVVEMLREMKIPFGVVVNKSGIGDNEIYEYCNSESLEILLEIPYSEDVARLYASGTTFSIKFPKYEKIFYNLFQKVKSEIIKEA
ncbi:ATP-binding protein [uncultured Ilyobacter sp.]|uniref:ATP-binding protein n=1 Tax=uncultured Ilyobacter sp. TaxID=544433 RepID=UPI0029C845A2|nr:ATP-binding protein [uncultured Ilyobacter sp.]